MAIAIVGGGVAGLATAHFLLRDGFDVELFEATGELGGLARSFEYRGQRNDLYYHFFCLPDRDILALGRELGFAHRFAWGGARTTFFHDGRLYPFTTPLDLARFSPIPPPARVRLGLEVLRWSYTTSWEELDTLPADEWLRRELGSRAFEEVWSPLLRMKFGEYAGRVSAAWIWHRIQRVAQSRRGWRRQQVMGYLRGGTQTIIDHLEEAVRGRGGTIHPSTTVEAVLEDRTGRLRGVCVAGETRPADAVVLAVPLPRAAPLLPDSLAATRAAFERVPFLGVACLAVHLDATVTGSFWCNIHDRQIPYSGLIETTELNPDAGAGDTLVYVPHYLAVDDPRFSLPDDVHREEFARAIERIHPGSGAPSIRAFRVFRSRFAQAVCGPGFRREVPPHTLPLPGLFLVDSTQLYPSDRTLSGTVGLARQVAREVERFARGGALDYS